MRPDVLKVFCLTAVLAMSVFACGDGTPSSDIVNDAEDTIVDTLHPDAGDTIITHDVDDATLDIPDVPPRDNGDNGDTDDDDAIDAIDGIEPDAGDIIPDRIDPDVIDVVDARDVKDVGTDSDSTDVVECMTDDDCEGKVSLESCQVATCNDDNICAATAAEDGTECNDNMICTENDVCTDGYCEGTQVDCNDNIECTQDLCNQANFCYHLPYYGPCNDGNACTNDDTCSTGTCLGVSITCDDGNSCTTDSCDRDVGCITTKISGTKCNDGDLCTSSDTCVQGVCQGTFNCDDGNPCTYDGCNELGCTHEGAPFEGNVCDDGLICTNNDSCRSGACSGDALICDDGDVCTDDYCLEGTGCKVRNNTASCNDGNACTRLDRCQNGLCKGSAYTCPLGTCMDANNCDGNGGCVPDYSDLGTPCASDNKQCTDDVCSGNGQCTHPNSAVGTACSDGDLCTQTDTCSNGVCVGNNPVACPVTDACKDAGTCDPQTGTCTLGALPEGSSCSDGLRCTRNDKCIAGACTGTAVVCPAITDCHLAGTCNEADGTCTEVFKDDGSTCNDGNKCTQTDSCVSGVCTGSNPVVCAALDQCHEPGVCNTGTGLCSNPVSANTKTCDDTQPCTQGDKCVNGSCIGTAYSCNDNRGCTADSCDGAGGCSYSVVPGWCFIDTECKLPGSVKPGNMCRVCDPSTSGDDWTPISVGFCDDFNDCTKDDVCASGECVGQPYPCDDGIPCTIDTCDGLGGCMHSTDPAFCLIDGKCYRDNEQNPEDPCEKCAIQWSQEQFTPRVEGDACDDGVACTWDDKCTSGTCAGTAYECNDNVECTTDSCVGDGTCLFIAIPGFCYIDNTCIEANTVQPGNACAACLPEISGQFWSGYREGEGCDDGSLCTVGDKCASGVCNGLPKCDDAIDCTTDTCNELGECTNTVAENYCAIDGNCYFYGDQHGLNQCSRCIPPTSNTSWTATDGGGCSDNDPCTTNDTCVGETCQGTAIVCDDHLACTSDFCQYGLCGTVPLSGWCVIGNQCIEAGSVDSNNLCNICDPNENPYDWTYNNFITCDDESDCTMNDICFVGICAGQVYDCTDGVICTADHCDGLGGCTYDVLADFCLIDGGCFATDEINIANSCLDCNPLISQFEWTSNDGFPCDDGFDCTSGDACLDGSCGGSAYVCNDGLVCTADSCNGDGTCNYERIAGWCLIDGECHRDQTLEPGNICRACLSSTNGTDWSNNNGLPCDDNESCTKLDTCDGGECAGTTYACDDGKFCTADSCDGLGGCNHEQMPGYCMIDYVCYDNGAPNPDNICEKCDFAVSAFQWSDNDGQNCEDFNSCTINSTCTGGVCSGTEYPCDDGIDCTLDLCDGLGGCANPLSPDACRINGVCYMEGDARPDIPCEACVPTTSQSDWTELNPGAIEICNGIDDNCDGILDPENAPGCVNYYKDFDLDGVGKTSDYKCLCSPKGDYRTIVAGDCDDNQALVYAGRIEECDGLDNNCDGLTDPDNTFGCQVYYVDTDSDTWGDETSSRCLCSAVGNYSTVQGGDCNDNNAAINPTSAEICNEIDDNCDGRTDPPNLAGCTPYYIDSDDDGFGDATVFACLCKPTLEFSVTNPDDCNDFSGSVYPGAPETCNDIDDDCSGITDNGDITDLCPHNPSQIQHASVACFGRCVVTCNDADPANDQPAWFDVDGNMANGCECQGDTLLLDNRMTSSDPLNLGNLLDTDAQIKSQVGKLNVAGSEEWFMVTALDSEDSEGTGGCDDFHFDIRLLSNPNDEFEFDIYRYTMVGNDLRLKLQCAGVQTWDDYADFYDAESGECPCSADYQPACDPVEDMNACKAVHGEDWVNRCNACPGMAQPSKHFCSNNGKTLYIKVRRKDAATPTCSTFQLEVSNGAY